MRYVVEYSITHPVTALRWDGEAEISATPVLVVPDAVKAIRKHCNGIPECPLGPVVIWNIREEVIPDEA